MVLVFWLCTAILERQLKKYERLCHKTRGGCSNHQSGCSNHTCNQAHVQDPTTTTTTTNATTRHKWVKSLSGVPLTKAQASLLAHGPGFAAAPKHPLYGDYIATIEQACINMKPHNAEEIRAEIRGALKQTHPPGGTSAGKKLWHLLN